MSASINCKSCLNDAWAASSLCAALGTSNATRWLCIASYCSRPPRIVSLRCKCDLSKEPDWCCTLLTKSKATCIADMLAQAVSLGCPSSTNVTCVCSNVDFSNGVSHCAGESCARSADVAAASSFAVQFCASGECPSGSPSVSLRMISRRERHRIRSYHW